MHTILEIALIAATPLAEAQVAVPWAYAHFGYSWAQAVGASLVGSITLACVLPWALFLMEDILDRYAWMRRVQQWLRARVEKRFTEKYRAWGWVGLLVFVAVPGPGSGVWTGALAAWILRYKPREASAALALGAVLAATSVAIIGSGAWRVWAAMFG